MSGATPVPNPSAPRVDGKQPRVRVKDRAARIHTYLQWAAIGFLVLQCPELAKKACAVTAIPIVCGAQMLSLPAVSSPASAATPQPTPNKNEVPL